MARARVLSAVSAVIGALTLAAYVALIVSEGDDTAAQVAPWAGAIGFATALAIAGAASTGRACRPLMFAAGGLFVSVALPGIFSIGLPLLMAGLLCIFGAPGKHRDQRVAAP